LAAIWNFDGPWSIQLRANYIATSHSVDTTSILLGIGYRNLEHDAALDSTQASTTELSDLRRELAVLLGRATVNDFNSEDSFAEQIEFRQLLGSQFAWTVGALNEGNAGTQRRSGVITQFWIETSSPDRRTILSLGIGPYVLLDVSTNPAFVEDSRERLAGILSVSFSYSLVPNWAARFTASRVFADNSHDADVLVLGACYRF